MYYISAGNNWGMSIDELNFYFVLGMNLSDAKIKLAYLISKSRRRMKAMNRSELLFLYDITDANPNGDPMDENKPRLDEETGINLVTDVRLKRTIRDYLHETKSQNIFVRKSGTKKIIYRMLKCGLKIFV